MQHLVGRDSGTASTGIEPVEPDRCRACRRRGSGRRMTVTQTLAIRGGESADVHIEGDRIVRATPGATAASTLDAGGCRVFPGFVDLQCNGGFGVDLTTSPERAREVAARLPATGVTSFLPTVITAPPEVTLRAITELDWLRHSSPGARSLGVHLEGPFINPSRGGAASATAHPAAESCRSGTMARGRVRRNGDARAGAGRRARPRRRSCRTRRRRQLRTL